MATGAPPGWTTKIVELSPEDFVRMYATALRSGLTERAQASGVASWSGDP
jgi:hypothetical protein